MDSALVVHPCPNSAEAAARVECRLLRDLRDGEQVVVGVEGLRSQRRPMSREGRESDVAFMAAGVCSERRAGIIHACVSRGVPFVLAGSIRDDGPLPDTEMDLIAAQAAYAKAPRGAEMVIMLSSMLHSISAGNMIPAGVKLVWVDLNPAVVTKLSDRGSLESVGMVTDVGSF
jgi:hypothetical protein